MRKIVLSGNTIYLTEKERRELLKRFDVSRVVKKEDNISEIPSDGCYLCTKYRVHSRACGDCPLNDEELTCGDLMEDIVGGAFAFHAEVLSGVWWEEYGGGLEARPHIRKIHRVLIGMERVTRRGR